MRNGEAQASRWGRLARLWEPDAGITHEADRRRARVAMALLFAMSALGVLNITMTLSGLYGEPSLDSLMEVGIIVGLVLSYFLARFGRVTAGVILAVASIEVALIVYRAQAEPGPGEQTMLYFLSIPILLAGLLLRARLASVVAVLTVVLALGVETYLDGVAGFDIDDIGLTLMLVAVALLSVAAATLNDRDAQALYENAQLLRQLSDNIPEVMFLIEGDGSRTLYTSPAYEAVLGRKVEQAMADPRDWLKAVHPDELPRVVKALEANAPQIEYRIVHPTAGVKHIRARTFPILGADGKVARLVGIAEDVTAAVQAQEQLREAQRQRIQLLQQLAHDLAAPLTPIKIHVGILAAKAAGPEEQRGIAVVERNVAHLQRLVEDVKDVARLEGEGLRMNRRPIDLVALVQQAVETLAPSAAERQVQVTVDAPRAIPAQGDAGRITQVLYNLVGNALKFTPSGGRIEVRLVVHGPEARVLVIDSGSGMRPDQLERLFKPFSQVHEPATIRRRDDKGSGLGLYISKGIVEAHGGRIEAASAGPGLGSTFTFRLPLAGPVDGPV